MERGEDGSRMSIGQMARSVVPCANQIQKAMQVLTVCRESHGKCMSSCECSRSWKAKTNKSTVSLQYYESRRRTQESETGNRRMDFSQGGCRKSP